MDALSAFIDNVVRLFIQPIIILIVTAGVAYFVFTIAYFMLYANDPKKRAEGTQAIIYGVIGVFVMVAAIGLIRLALNTFGV